MSRCCLLYVLDIGRNEQVARETRRPVAKVLGVNDWMVCTGQGPDEMLQGVFAQPLGGVGDFCRDCGGLRFPVSQC